ncbi:uncharacterized protein MONOS_5438 [Monocercomonoides exilis]|uniref:uncharacterized protein n=1 Tax=Monocercomonoides exilis TaxID=2049356 RepID=UPI003559B554|nr:hypothetical protein MONOS_5438 [Monocercomonoides exilis]|eukprot:MONOS_5438.1-p1 / transcript=MONOS_5438.1 / gene=MONOS_5438 / organism=Monocercomonoides_exilis_PA203 / gene_product=unspecified product / transcript_product=unspecified product / location=Mono_scaffold00158:20178-20408(-) / protein_length=77 / sequence_SO=supercontig / SO=protein_coding / is_pseudo=false
MSEVDEWNGKEVEKQENTMGQVKKKMLSGEQDARLGLNDVVDDDGNDIDYHAVDSDGIYLKEKEKTDFEGGKFSHC